MRGNGGGTGIGGGIGNGTVPMGSGGENNGTGTLGKLSTCRVPRLDIPNCAMGVAGDTLLVLDVPFINFIMSPTISCDPAR